MNKFISFFFISLLISNILCTAAYGADCDDSSNACDSTTQTCDSSTNKCVCATGYTENTNKDGCEEDASTTTVAYGATCDGTTTICDSTTQTCDSSTKKCVCASGYSVNSAGDGCEKDSSTTNTTTTTNDDSNSSFIQNTILILLGMILF